MTIRTRYVVNTGPAQQPIPALRRPRAAARATVESSYQSPRYKLRTLALTNTQILANVQRQPVVTLPAAEPIQTRTLSDTDLSTLATPQRIPRNRSGHP
jgi:hypothetical protein